YRDPEPSKYILYEIALCSRTRKPILVFVEDVLPDDCISGVVFQRRFSRRHLLREVRNHRHAIQIFKTYIGTEPPPVYHPSQRRRSCLVIGGSSLNDRKKKRLKEHLIGLQYSPVIAPGGQDFLSFDRPYEWVVEHSVLCVAFTEGLSPLEYYLLGAT